MDTYGCMSQRAGDVGWGQWCPQGWGMPPGADDVPGSWAHRGGWHCPQGLGTSEGTDGCPRMLEGGQCVPKNWGHQRRGPGNGRGDSGDPRSWGHLEEEDGDPKRGHQRGDVILGMPGEGVTVSPKAGDTDPGTLKGSAATPSSRGHRWGRCHRDNATPRSRGHQRAGGCKGRGGGQRAGDTGGWHPEVLEGDKAVPKMRGKWMAGGAGGGGGPCPHERGDIRRGQFCPQEQGTPGRADGDKGRGQLCPQELGTPL